VAPSGAAAQSTDPYAANSGIAVSGEVASGAGRDLAQAVDLHREGARRQVAEVGEGTAVLEQRGVRPARHRGPRPPRRL